MGSNFLSASFVNETITGLQARYKDLSVRHKLSSQAVTMNATNVPDSLTFADCDLQINQNQQASPEAT